MNQLRKQQQGMTVIGMILLGVIIGFSLLMAVKIVPVYMEYFQVVKMLSSMQGDTQLAIKGEGEIMSSIGRRLSVMDNTMPRVKKEHFKVVRTPQGYEVIAAYEVRIKMLGNFYGLAVFSKKAVLNV